MEEQLASGCVGGDPGDEDEAHDAGSEEPGRRGSKGAKVPGERSLKEVAPGHGEPEAPVRGRDPLMAPAVGTPPLWSHTQATLIDVEVGVVMVGVRPDGRVRPRRGRAPEPEETSRSSPLCWVSDE